MPSSCAEGHSAARARCRRPFRRDRRATRRRCRWAGQNPSRAALPLPPVAKSAFPSPPRPPPPACFRATRPAESAVATGAAQAIFSAAGLRLVRRSMNFRCQNLLRRPVRRRRHPFSPDAFAETRRRHRCRSPAGSSPPAGHPPRRSGRSPFRRSRRSAEFPIDAPLHSAAQTGAGCIRHDFGSCALCVPAPHAIRQARSQRGRPGAFPARSTQAASAARSACRVPGAPRPDSNAAETLERFASGIVSAARFRTGLDFARSRGRRGLSNASAARRSPYVQRRVVRRLPARTGARVRA